MIRNYYIIATSILALILSGCIKDDIIFDTVDPVVKITNPLDTLQKNTSYQLEYLYFNEVGKKEDKSVTWLSSDTTSITVDQTGLVSALDTGKAMITAYTLYSGDTVKDEQMIVVGDTTILAFQERTGIANTTSSYELTGSFVLREENDVLTLSFGADYKASTALPGLFIYLSNNPNTSAGALEIGAVTIFEGEHSYTLPAGTGINDWNYVLFFCKPFNVKVGHGVIN